MYTRSSVKTTVFFEAIHEIHSLTSGSITLGACSSTCINWIPGILNGFRQLYPKIEIRVKGGVHNKNIEDFLRNNEIDLGIAAIEPSTYLCGTEIYRDEMLCVTSKAFLSKKPGIITPEELKGLPLVLQNGDFAAEALAVLSALNISSTPYVTAVDDASLVAMVSGGLGYCVVGRLVLKGTSLPVNVHSFDPPQYRHIALLHNKRIMLSPVGKALRGFILNYVKNYSANEDPSA